MTIRFLLFSLFLCCCFTMTVNSAAVSAASSPDESRAKWSILTGYGSSHPGWGETQERVETIDLVLRRSSVILKDMGESWYAGYHSLFLELPVHYLPDYSDSPMIGLNFIASYTFTSSALSPYVFFGGGPVYFDADIPGMGSDWNGNYQFGIGCTLPVTPGNEIFIETRFHHISNGNTEDPNDPLNSTKFLVGFTF